MKVATKRPGFAFQNLCVKGTLWAEKWTLLKNSVPFCKQIIALSLSYKLEEKNATGIEVLNHYSMFQLFLQVVFL